ncbi:uncharacterized protein I303_101434 [Kwoniella dejecticola CBS 10117]|uniref:Uncharacterized protein n=1 Tax=Kwoniella dejecticola CBS 10117 TaxID=1296121 RepID=A0A1A6AHS0_9TREE|nr:uncharacterized protein I303_01443 [Kwoniella dejecticola CBS 10117]OBR89614.1 hypothetical protein I303_01443 [Kwoniella dejecticola CBS 10117]
MPTLLEYFGDLLYSNKAQSEGSPDAQQVQTDQPQSTSSESHLAHSESNTTQPTHPSSQALFQSIYNKGYFDGTQTSFSTPTQILQLLTTHSTGIALAFSAVSFTSITMLALALSKRSPSTSGSLRSIGLASGGSVSAYAQGKGQFRQLRLFGNSATVRSSLGAHAHSSSGAAQGPLSPEEIETALEKLKEELLAAKEIFDAEAEAEESIGEQADKAPGGFKNGQTQTQPGGNDAEVLLNGLKTFFEHNEQGLTDGKKLVMDFFPDGTSEMSLQPKDVEMEELEHEDSAIPSTYLKGDTTNADIDNFDNVDLGGASSPMALRGLWEKVRFEPVSWDEHQGEVIMRLFVDGQPDETIQEELKVQAVFKDGVPTSITHQGLVFEVDATNECLPDGAPIWKFSRLILDFAARLNEIARDEEVNEANLIDQIIVSRREKNAHIFEASVVPTDLAALIDAIVQKQRVEFWLDEKIGKSVAVGAEGKKETWKVRVAMYDLYEEPQWSEMTATIHFLGFPTTITLPVGQAMASQRDPIPIPIVGCSDGQYVVSGQEGEEW